MPLDVTIIVADDRLIANWSGIRATAAFKSGHNVGIEGTLKAIIGMCVVWVGRTAARLLLSSRSSSEFAF